MIDELKKLYKNHMIFNRSTTSSPEKYDWFQTKDENFGILKSSLSDKERSLLEMMFTPVEPTSNLSDEETFWHDLLFKNHLHPKTTNNDAKQVRFVQFYITEAVGELESFSEAVAGLYPTKPIILWENEQEGILIDYPFENDDPHPYYDLTDVVMSDFYTKVFLYVGKPHKMLEFSHQQFQWEKACFTLCRKTFPEKNVYRYVEEIPFLLLQHAPKSIRTKLFNGLLQDVDEDKELLKSIKNYLESNMNVTTAAKKLFMHRNSLQYRVDKFVEKTGLDVRTFKEAIPVYLALLNRNL